MLRFPFTLSLNNNNNNILPRSFPYTYPVIAKRSHLCGTSNFLVLFTNLEIIMKDTGSFHVFTFIYLKKLGTLYYKLHRLYKSTKRENGEKGGDYRNNML